MTKKVLITGAEGFIGSNLVDYFIKKKIKLKCFVQYNSFNNWGWLESHNSHKKLNICFGDIRDPEFVDKTVSGCTHVIHLASLISIPHSYKSVSSYIETNINGTLNLLQASVKHKVKKFIQTSTSEVYGTAQKIPIDESHPLNAQSPYAATKIAADQLALSFYKSYDLPVTILRPFNTFGPRQSGRAVIPTIITQILKKDKITLGSLSPSRDFNFVEDVMHAFYLALNNKKIVGEVINIGSGYEISINKLKQIISQILKKKIQIKKANERYRPKKSEVQRLLCNNKKAKNILKWNPKYSGKNGLEKGLKKTIKWFSEESNLKKYKTDIYNT